MSNGYVTRDVVHLTVNLYTTIIGGQSQLSITTIGNSPTKQNIEAHQIQWQLCLPGIHISFFCESAATSYTPLSRPFPSVLSSCPMLL
jgi:hypothetical protein